MTSSDPGTGPATPSTGEKAALALRRYLRYPEDDSVVRSMGTPDRDQEPYPDDWLPLPDWAQFSVALGSAVALHQEGTARLIAAVATPNRAYVAAFCATGYVLALSGTMPPVDYEENYRYLAGLPSGTTVTFWPTPTLKKTGLLVACVEANGQRYVKIALGVKLRDTDYVRVDECGKVQVCRQQFDKLPSRARMRRVRVQNGLIATVVTACDLNDFLSQCRPACTIVGSESQLRAEIREAPFAILGTFREAASDKAVGHLQDILRVPQFSTGGQCCWAEVHSFIAEKKLRRSTKTPPRLVIFDGSSAFLKCQGYWPNSSWIAILDRTDPRFLDASSEIDRLYASRSETRVPNIAFPSVPSDLDCVLFEEGHR